MKWFTAVLAVFLAVIITGCAGTGAKTPRKSAVTHSSQDVDMGGQKHHLTITQVDNDDVSGLAVFDLYGGPHDLKIVDHTYQAMLGRTDVRPISINVYVEAGKTLDLQMLAADLQIMESVMAWKY